MVEFRHLVLYWPHFLNDAQIFKRKEKERRKRHEIMPFWLAGSFGSLSSGHQSDEEELGASSESTEGVDSPQESMLPQWNTHISIYSHTSLAGPLDASLAAMETAPCSFWGYATRQFAEWQVRFSADYSYVQVTEMFESKRTFMTHIVL
jgi:hypothetical protein